MCMYRKPTIPYGSNTFARPETARVHRLRLYNNIMDIAFRRMYKAYIYLHLPTYQYGTRTCAATDNPNSYCTDIIYILEQPYIPTYNVYPLPVYHFRGVRCIFWWRVPHCEVGSCRVCLLINPYKHIYIYNII